MEIAELIQLAGTSGLNVIMVVLFLRERQRSAALSDSRVELLRECYGDLLREQARNQSKGGDPPTLPR